MNPLTCPPDQYEAYEWQEKHPNSTEMPPSESFLRNKRMYEARRFDGLASLVERYKGIRPTGNYVHFATNWGDVDINYPRYINE